MLIEHKRGTERGADVASAYLRIIRRKRGREKGRGFPR